jgi:isoquinoline 1-oxidoreductase beta subunit
MAQTACPTGWVDNPLVFVAIGEDGIVSIVCHRSEMEAGRSHRHADDRRRRAGGGLGARARGAGDRRRKALWQPGHRRLAQHAPLLHADASAAAPPHGRCWKPPRPARWKVPVGEVQAKNGEVVHASTGRRLGYGTLAKAAASNAAPAADQIKLKDPSQFRYIGTGKLTLWTAPTSPAARRSTGWIRGCLEWSTPSSRGRRCGVAR